VDRRLDQLTVGRGLVVGGVEELLLLATGGLLIVNLHDSVCFHLLY
jgi:hypothetical protein